MKKILSYDLDVTLKVFIEIDDPYPKDLSWTDYDVLREKYKESIKHAVEKELQRLTECNFKYEIEDFKRNLEGGIVDEAHEFRSAYHHLHHDHILLVQSFH